MKDDTKGNWLIEYEIPPLRAIYHMEVYDCDESEAREEFRNSGGPLRRIRKMSKRLLGDWRPLAVEVIGESEVKSLEDAAKVSADRLIAAFGKKAEPTMLKAEVKP